jgi:hypothetical protein
MCRKHLLNRAARWLQTKIIYILGLEFDNVGIFCGQLEHFMYGYLVYFIAFWYILR